MPRYFFHVQNQTSYTRDEAGEVLADLAVAHAHGSDAAGQILISELRDGKSDVTLQIQIEDEVGTRLLTFDVATRVSEGLSD